MRLIFAALTLIGCYDVARLETAPPEITSVVVLELDDTDAVIGTSALVPWQAGQALPLGSPSRKAIVAGYAAGALSAELEARLATGPVILRRADCDVPELPFPTWAATISAGAVSSLDWAATSALPRFAVEAATTCTPTDRVSIDIRGLAQPCTVVPVPRGGCALGLDVSACVEAGARVELPARLDPDGRVQVNFGCSPWRCGPAKTPRAAGGAFDCAEPALEIDTYGPDVAALDFEVASKELFVAEPFQPSALDVRFVIYPEYRYRGHLQDGVLSGDELWVTTTEGNHLGCRLTRFFSTLYRLDPDSLEILGSQSTPTCLERMIPRPSHTGFYGLHSQGGRWVLSEMDGTATILRSVALATDDREISSYEDWALDVIRLDGPEPLLVVLVRFDDGERLRHYLLYYSETSFSRLRAVPIDDAARPDYLGATGDGRLIVPEAAGQRIRFFGREGTIEDDLDVDANIQLQMLEPITLTNPPRLAISGQDRAFVRDLTTRTTFERFMLDPQLALVTGAEWPRGSNQILWAGTTYTPGASTPFELSLVRYDLGTERFLPPIQKLGPGMFGRNLLDDRGRMFLFSPWNATIFRITARGSQ